MAEIGDTQPVVAAALRTPIGRYGGQFKEVRPDDLAAAVLRAACDRAEVGLDEIEDVVLGCANQAGEDNRNVARMALLLAGLPVEVGGQTVNRLCGSGMQALVTAAREIQIGNAQWMAAGGVESMTRAPWVMPKPEVGHARGEVRLYDTALGWRMVNPKLAELYEPLSMGETAEKVAERYGVGREAQDSFALQSHRRAVAAQDAGRFGDEIVAVNVPSRPGGQAASVEMDEGPRRDTSIAALARLRPAFKAEGTVTAGNSSSLNDGAACLVLTSWATARRRGLEPLARFVGASVAGVDPSFMGMGPVPATRKLLARHELEIGDLDLVEINEAFASQSLACISELGLDPERVNVNGGAIALGHPLGCSGARIVCTLIHEMRRRGARRGLATMCIGVGQGIASLWEAM